MGNKENEIIQRRQEQKAAINRKKNYSEDTIRESMQKAREQN